MNYLDATKVYNDATKSSPVVAQKWRLVKRKCAASKKAIDLSEQGKIVIGVLKIGANITFSSTMNRTAANFDIISLCRALAPNFHLHFVTKITRNTVIPKQSSITDIMKAGEDINNLSIHTLLIFNGSMNAYGGVEPVETIMIWKIINTFRGRIFYIHTDGMMRLHNVWNDNWAEKGWADHWKKEEIVIKRQDIAYITQARDNSKIKQLTRSNSSIPIKDENIHHFPIEQAVLLKAPFKPKERKITWDLIYGGSFRSGRRRDRMVKWFFGHKKPELKVLMYGSLSIQKFGNPGIHPYPEIEGPVANSEFVNKLSTGLATVIIVDDFYRNHWMALRFYEMLIAGVVPFIDILADTSRKLYFPNSPIKDFLYVKKRKELAERIELIKREDCLNEVIDICRDTVRQYWDPIEYKEKLKNIIVENL